MRFKFTDVRDAIIDHVYSFVSDEKAFTYFKEMMIAADPDDLKDGLKNFWGIEAAWYNRDMEFEFDIHSPLTGNEILYELSKKGIDKSDGQPTEKESSHRIRGHVGNTIRLLETVMDNFIEEDYQKSVDSLGCMKMRLEDHIALINIHRETFK